MISIAKFAVPAGILRDFLSHWDENGAVLIDVEFIEIDEDSGEDMFQVTARGPLARVAYSRIGYFIGATLLQHEMVKS